MRLVLIEWLDSHVAVGGWKELDGFAPEAPICRSVGWLARDDDHSKVVIPHVIEQQENVPLQGCGDMTIPTAAILRMIELKTPDTVGAMPGAVS
jgi:hypothetical protein